MNVAMALRFNKEQSIYLVTKQSSAAPDVFCSMELEEGTGVSWKFASRCTKFVIQKNLKLLSTMLTYRFNTEGLCILLTDCIYMCHKVLTTASIFPGCSNGNQYLTISRN
jgi:hypothetical protein